MCRDGGARRELSAGRFVCGAVCLRGGLFAGWSVYGADSLRLRNLSKGEVRAGTGEPDRETGKRETGNGKRGRKSGRSVVG